MRPQLDLRPGRVMLALSAVGVGGACVTGALAEADSIVTAGSPSARAPAPLIGGGAAAALGAPPIGGGAAAAALGAPPIGAGAGAAALGAPTPALWALATRRNVLVGGRVSVYGRLRAAGGRGVVALQVHRAAGWVTVTRGRTTRAGRYALGFRPQAPGSIALRVAYAAAGRGGPALDALPVVNVYRLAGASWYGPGGPLACGGTLTAATVGVAHKTLPCGTMVRLHLGNRTVRVPVIDRGPYVSGRDFDLTPATKRALGFGDTGEIWSTR